MKIRQSASLIMQIASVNLRHNFLPLCYASLAIASLIPVLFGLNKLPSNTVAIPMEMLLSTIGIVLFAPIFQPEDNSDIEDVVASKYIDIGYIYIIRTLYSLITMVLIISLFSIFLLHNECEVTFRIVYGTIADGLFLGGLGLIAAAFSRNITVAIMLPTMYYLSNLMLMKKLGVFNLFAMKIGNYAPNNWLFISGIILIVLAMVIRRGMGCIKLVR